jgi:hypothetical protein
MLREMHMHGETALKGRRCRAAEELRRQTRRHGRLAGGIAVGRTTPTLAERGAESLGVDRYCKLHDKVLLGQVF